MRLKDCRAIESLVDWLNHLSGMMARDAWNKSRHGRTEMLRHGVMRNIATAEG